MRRLQHKRNSEKKRKKKKNHIKEKTERRFDFQRANQCMRECQFNLDHVRIIEFWH